VCGVFAFMLRPDVVDCVPARGRVTFISYGAISFLSDGLAHRSPVDDVRLAHGGRPAPRVSLTESAHHTRRALQ